MGGGAVELLPKAIGFSVSHSYPTQQEGPHSIVSRHFYFADKFTPASTSNDFLLYQTNSNQKMPPVEQKMARSI